MKNKIFKKILLVVVCVSVLVASLVVPSFAYTWSSPSPYNNDVGSFNLPYSYIDIEKIDNGLDLPEHVILSTTSSHSLPRSNMLGNGTVSYILPDGRNSSLGFSTTVYNSTVYDTSYYYGGYFNISSSYDDLSYPELYLINEIHYGDVWISDIDLHNYSGSIYNSLQLTCAPSVPVVDESTGKNQLIATYDVDYITSDGELRHAQLGSFVDLSTRQDDVINTAYFMVSVPYLPAKFGEYLDSDIVYIADVTITLEDYNQNKVRLFYRDADDTNNIQATSFFINRCRPSSEFNGEVYDIMTDSIYQKAFREGVDEGVKLAGVNPFDFIMNSVSSFIDWEFIPGVSFGIILSIIVGVVLVLTFLKFFAGG